MSAPAHYNPPPMFGLRLPWSRTQQVVRRLLEEAGEQGIEARRLPALLYMSDIIARQYLGHPLTDIQWTKEMLFVGALP